MVKTATPPEIVSRPLSESGVRSRYGITVVSVKRPGRGVTHATPDTIVHEGDVLIVSGRITDVETFAGRVERR